MLGYARVRIADAATCEDVTSRVFTTALEQLGRFRGQGSFAGWLFQIARNTVRDVHRRRPTAPLAEERPRRVRVGHLTLGKTPPRSRRRTAEGFSRLRAK